MEDLIHSKGKHNSSDFDQIVGSHPADCRVPVPNAGGCPVRSSARRHAASAPNRTSVRRHAGSASNRSSIRRAGTRPVRSLRVGGALVPSISESEEIMSGSALVPSVTLPPGCNRAQFVPGEHDDSGDPLSHNTVNPGEEPYELRKDPNYVDEAEDQIEIEIEDEDQIEIEEEDEDEYGDELSEYEGRGAAKSWIVQVHERFDSRQVGWLKPTSDVSIYRVPKSIGASKASFYCPQVVSFGPYHHKKYQKFSAMDDHKLEAVQRTLRRLNGHGRPQDVIMYDLTSEVQKLEGDIRGSYEDGAFEWDIGTLAWMLTMDASFILEFFRNDTTEFSLVFQNVHNVIKREILWDILKLENQIPFCVLKLILQLELGAPESVSKTLAAMLSKSGMFNGFPFTEKSDANEIIKHIDGGASHLLDLCKKVIEDFLTVQTPQSTASHSVFLNTACCSIHCNSGRDASSKDGKFCSSMPPATRPRDDVSSPSAERLEKAGIKFQPSPEGNVLFEEKLSGSSTLFLPQITVDDNTERLLRNLMAFEECQRYKQSSAIISLYIRLMDDLIDSKEDVALLRKQKIIISLMGCDEETATVFNDLCKGISVDRKHQFTEVLKQVRAHYNSLWKVSINQFKEEHCSKPWYVVSFLVAIIILVMTAVQTIYSVKN